MLTNSLDRLRHTLDTLGDRLRDAVSSAVGETVAGVVRHTMHALLAGPANIPRDPPRYRHLPPNPHPLWVSPQEPDDGQPFDDLDGELTDEGDYPPAERVVPTPQPSRLPHALALGAHTAFCWLRRGIGYFPVATACTVGLLTAAATYAGGPLAAAAIGLAGSAYSLLSLAESVHAGAETLAAFGTP